MKKVKADDYVSNGFFEAARFGNTVVARNNMTKEQHEQWILDSASHYEEKKEEINGLIEKIKDKLALVNPLMLFNFLTSMNTMMLMSSEVTSESEIPADVTFQLRSVEYVQSLLVSMEHDKDDEIKEEEQEPVYHEIASLCYELYRKIPMFYMYWIAKQQTIGNLSTEAFTIDREKYSQIYMFDVTVSDFNEFASRFEKVRIAKGHEGIIVISLNDLWVYKHYFDNPLQFIHFIKQRTIATETVEIVTTDELDHLGMYISHNMYSLQAKDIGQGQHVNFMGYREELDKYLSSMHIGAYYEKPTQFIPPKIAKIIEICLDKDDKVTQFTNSLLDLSADSREGFEKSISNLARRERELGRMLPAVSFGDSSYALFVEVPNIVLFPKDKQEKYILANLAQNQKEYCWSITVVLDEIDNILDVQYKLYSQNDISEKDRAELTAYGKEIVERRTEQFLIQNNRKKIYPNEPCICGSGKKYKRCCGRK